MPPPRTKLGLQLNIDKSTRITNGRLAEEKSYNQRFAEEATQRLAETQTGLALLPRGAAEIPEGFLSCEVVL